MLNSLIGWWWCNRVISQSSTLSILRLQPVWGLCVPGRHEVSFLHLVGALVPAKQLRNVHWTYLYLWNRTGGPWLIYCLSYGYSSAWLSCLCFCILYFPKHWLLGPVLWSTWKAQEVTVYFHSLFSQSTISRNTEWSVTGKTPTWTCLVLYTHTHTHTHTHTRDYSYSINKFYLKCHGECKYDLTV